MKSKIKSKSLSTKILKFLIIFSVLILTFLWLFQVIFLDKYYESYKTKEIKKAANEIINEIQKTNSLTKLDEIAFKTGVCIEVTNKKGEKIYESAAFKKECLNAHTAYYRYLFINNDLTEQAFKITNPTLHNKSIIYSTKINPNIYLFINSSLAPIDSTVKILTSQLIYVTIIVLLISVIIAFFISRKIASPLEKMNIQAKKLALGDFDIYFDETNDIEEIATLNKTLNYARCEMSRTDELRRDLMANVSHDLKTPLTMIKAYAEMVRDLTYKNKEKREKNLNTIIEEVDRLNLLVNDILSLSSLESNAVNLKLETFSLNELITTILNRYQIFTTTEEYTFIFNEKEEIYIEADKQKIEQVIYNLINNAINYTGDDKKVFIEYKIDNKFITLKIKDTGKGISKNDIKNIWDKYYKKDKNHQRNVIGTGLGLSIVKNILEKHEFNYGVESTKNKGTCFYFQMPIIDKKP